VIVGREEITTDATRIAANVITGVGFLCAASLVTRKNGSKHGLTTAAGLWTTAVIGLSCGCGWVEVGLLASVIVLLVFALLGRVDAYITKISRGFDLYAEVDGFDQVPHLLTELRAHRVQFSDLDVSKSSTGTAIVTLKTSFPRRLSRRSTPPCCRRSVRAIPSCSPTRSTTTCRPPRCT
jgi:uncharacterized membrane protein YhiD involved in acid resistance